MKTVKQCQLFNKLVFSLDNGNQFHVGNPRRTKIIHLVPMVESITGQKIVHIKGVA